MNIPAIRVQHVSKSFGSKPVVEDVSFDIHSGEIVTILGPNGAGKSTTINMMLGIVKPSAGQVLLNGMSPHKTIARQRFGAMLQHIGLPHTLKTIELIELWSSYYHAPLSKNEIIEIAGLQELLTLPFGVLSGGQKRRVAFALAICGNPDILFLDEPSAGLDIVSRSLLWKEIRRFASNNKTVVLCTHYLDEADALSNRIILMSNGKIIADAPPVLIKEQVGKKIIRCKTKLDFTAIFSLNGVESVQIEMGIATIEATQPEKILHRLFEMDNELHELEVKRIDLEKAFLQLTAQ